jgi:2-oxoglutarate ferredoxin oxidoreductase subunit gamma
MTAGSDGRTARAARAERARSAAAARTGLLAARELIEVRFGGSGGQGVILMGVILAMAGARDHRYVVQTQSYGPEARGGYSRSDVMISDSIIDYPELERADLLVVLSQAAADEYIGLLRSDGVLVYDSENVTAVPPFKGDRFGIPFTRLALEETGRSQTTNILTLGAVAGITGVVTTESLRKAVLAMVPRGTEEMNIKALARGLALDAAEWRGAADLRRSRG